MSLAGVSGLLSNELLLALAVKAQISNDMPLWLEQLKYQGP
jgi:hypothetical protein